MAVPEYSEWAIGWSPEREEELLTDPAVLERALRGELSITEELYLLNAARAYDPAAFVYFCRRILDGLSAEQRARIEEEYRLQQQLFLAQREERRRKNVSEPA